MHAGEAYRFKARMIVRGALKWKRAWTLSIISHPPRALQLHA